jgi:SAM-dependent methyltransferase
VEKQVDWFASWFDSPYYHRLYKHRDEEEAEKLLSSLIRTVPMKKGSKVLDVACGKGRHAVFLHKNGFDVTGFDLSEASIRHNKSFENDSLHFYVHDMRNQFRTNYFDYAVNLFSSFGYFESDHENRRAMQAIVDALKHGGILIFDYANSAFVRKQLVEEAVEKDDSITFKINKRIEGDHVIKAIQFRDAGQDYRYEERLRLYSLEALTSMIASCGATIKQCYGDYGLHPFQEAASERILLVAQKN